jgi:hypothetical protein
MFGAWELRWKAPGALAALVSRPQAACFKSARVLFIELNVFYVKRHFL